MIQVGPALRDFFKLHLVVLLWGFTAILGKLITLPAPTLVLYRAGLTAAGLLVLLRLRGIPAGLSGRSVLALLGTGLLIGLHWSLFFLSAKISNVSVCLVALATTSLWTALLEPLMVKGRKAKISEIILSFVVLGAMTGIFGGGFRYWPGFLVGTGAALAGTLFSILNGRLAGHFHHQVIACYEMLGAALFCAVCVFVPAAFWPRQAGLDLVPSWAEVGWLLLLAGFCTVYAYAEYVELLKRLSVFTVSLAVNLEPVYGMILAALIFGEHRVLGGRFYAGAAIILATVVVHPWLERRGRMAGSLAGAGQAGG